MKAREHRCCCPALPGGTEARPAQDLPSGDLHGSDLRAHMEWGQTTRQLDARQGDSKSALDLISYPRPHGECLEVFFCVLKVTTAIISRHVTVVVHREFNKGQGVSQTESMVSGTE